jgi:hypothetical protein
MVNILEHLFYFITYPTCQLEFYIHSHFDTYLRLISVC